MSIELIQGDCLRVLPTLPADHFHCVMTSPPYFALRSYLPKGHPDKAKEIGSEPTPEAFVETMVRVFREVRRVMQPSGLLFLNLGDSYATNSTRGRKDAGGAFRPGRACPGREPVTRGEPKDNGQLPNMPHRVAEALRADGWVWRQTIIWFKKSPMPESCKGWRWERCRVKVKAGELNRRGNECRLPAGKMDDVQWAQWSPCPGCAKCEPHGGYVLRKGRGRCTTAHEFVFVMAKSDCYFWDSAAFVEESKPESANRYKYAFSGSQEGAHPPHDDRYAPRGMREPATTRNPRSVWMLSSEPTSVPHFATYPSELVRRCVQAGTSDGGCCPECGEPWAPVVETERLPTRPGNNSKVYVDPEGSPYEQHSGDVIGNRDPQRHCTDTRILGYRPTCDHGLPSIPCRVLDPFAGIGTTLQTAQWMKREATGIELNPEYRAHAETLIDEPPRWWRRKHKTKPRPKDCPGQLTLF